MNTLMNKLKLKLQNDPRFIFDYFDETLEEIEGDDIPKADSNITLIKCAVKWQDENYCINLLYYRDCSTYDFIIYNYGTDNAGPIIKTKSVNPYVYHTYCTKVSEVPRLFNEVFLIDKIEKRKVKI